MISAQLPINPFKYRSTNTAVVQTDERRVFPMTRLFWRNCQLLTDLNLIGVSQLIAIRKENSHVLVRVAVVLLADLLFSFLLFMNGHNYRPSVSVPGDTFPKLSKSLKRAIDVPM